MAQVHKGRPPTGEPADAPPADDRPPLAGEAPDDPTPADTSPAEGVGRRKRRGAKAAPTRPQAFAQAGHASGTGEAAALGGS